MQLNKTGALRCEFGGSFSPKTTLAPVLVANRTL